MAVTDTAEYVAQNRQSIPLTIIAGTRIALGIVLAFFSLHIISTAYGSIAEDVIMQAGAAVAVLAFLVVFIIMAYGLFLSWGHLRATWHEPQAERPAKLLSAPSAQTWPPDISPDILICGTDKAAFAENVVMAEKRTTNAVWAVIIPPFKTEPSILTADNATNYFFSRGSEPFADIVPAELSLPVGLDHINETEKQYQQYVTWFCHWYKQWRTGAKLEADKARAKRTYIDIILEDAKAVTAALCFILLCLPAFGQSKAQQVDAALGAMNSDVPKRGDEITFIFEEGGKEKYYNRTGDGRSEYIDLLRRTTGIVRYKDEGGQLVAITKNGALVARGAMVERVNLSPSTASSQEAPNGYATESTTGDRIRPRTLLDAPDVENTPVTDQPMDFSIPTPEEIETTLDNADRVIDYRKTELWAAVKPIWWWVMGVFFSIVPLFICAGGLFRYYAGTAANEAFYGLSWVGSFIRRVHETASGVTLIICWGIATVLLLDEFMFFVYYGIPLWAILITWFPSLWLAKVLTNWAVPNPPAMIQSGFGADPYERQRPKAIAAGR